MGTVRLTTAQALVTWLANQYTRTPADGQVRACAGVFAIFGHGNVTCLGEALYPFRDELPVYRGQNEQGMALAATAYAKHTGRRRFMACTTSIGPGAMNMVTAAGVAMANRLPLLMLSGDTFASRLPDPVLQQVEHFHDPSRTVNDAFRAVVRYWDRIVRPEQLLSTLPQALSVLLDPAECGPVFLGLPQDVQEQAYDFPADFFAPRVHRPARPRADTGQLDAAAAALAEARRPLIVAGGGVHYSAAEEELARFAERHRVPVAETVAGRVSLPWDHPRQAGPLGVTGSTSANALAAEADVVLAVGTRLQDFTTGSWTVFQHPDLTLIGLNVSRFDAVKHRALPVVGDARRSLEELSAGLGGWSAPPAWLSRAADAGAEWRAAVDAAVEPTDTDLPTYAQVIGVVNRTIGAGDVVLTAAGGLPGELNKVWRGTEPGTFDCEYGFSCMGYEIAGGWGAAMARPDREVVVLAGDGSYLMLNSDLYSSVLHGHRFTVVLCDNRGFAVIDRLQRSKGGPAYGNMFSPEAPAVDFAAHARALGCLAEEVSGLDALGEALAKAREADRTTVIVLRTDPDGWTGGDAFWDVGVPEVSPLAEVRAARADQEAGRRAQRP
ncbi:MAG: 3D-(3,5/4)-trihydroxycyclohexane-1,2-dione acylhydrolase (decyclizing) [Mycobacteriales bacterium]